MSPHSRSLPAKGYRPQLPCPRSANAGLAARRCRGGERDPHSPHRGGGTPSLTPAPLNPAAGPHLPLQVQHIDSAGRHRRGQAASRPLPLPLPREVASEPDPAAASGSDMRGAAEGHGENRREWTLNSPGVLSAGTVPGALVQPPGGPRG